MAKIFTDAELIAMMQTAKANANMNDTGIDGKIPEMVIRMWLKRNTAVFTPVTGIATAGKTDAHVNYKVNGKRKQVTLEIKTACGCIDDVHRSQYVCYCPEVDYNVCVLDQFHVVPRDEFMELLNNYPGRGQTVRYNSKRGVYQIQSFRSAGRPKASKPIRVYLESALSPYPTLRQWEHDLRNQ